MKRVITNNLKILFIFALHLSLGGGIGRRARLKLVFHWSVGSIPTLGTKPSHVREGFFISSPL